MGLIRRLTGHYEEKYREQRKECQNHIDKSDYTVVYPVQLSKEDYSEIRAAVNKNKKLNAKIQKETPEVVDETLERMNMPEIEELDNKAENEFEHVIRIIEPQISSGNSVVYIDLDTKSSIELLQAYTEANRDIGESDTLENGPSKEEAESLTSLVNRIEQSKAVFMYTKEFENITGLEVSES